MQTQPILEVPHASESCGEPHAGGAQRSASTGHGPENSRSPGTRRTLPARPVHAHLRRQTRHAGHPTDAAAGLRRWHADIAAATAGRARLQGAHAADAAPIPAELTRRAGEAEPGISATGQCLAPSSARPQRLEAARAGGVRTPAELTPLVWHALGAGPGVGAARLGQIAGLALERRVSTPCRARLHHRPRVDWPRVRRVDARPGPAPHRGGAPATPHAACSAEVAAGARQALARSDVTAPCTRAPVAGRWTARLQNQHRREKEPLTHRGGTQPHLPDRGQRSSCPGRRRG